MPQLVNLPVCTRTDRNEMPEMLQVFVNLGTKGQIKYKQNYRTIKIKKAAELDAVTLKGLICLRGGWLWQGGQRVRKQEQNKSAIWNSESSHSGGINEK